MAQSVHGLPALIEQKCKVCIVPPELKGPRWREVVSCSGDESGQLIKFKGIDDIDAASVLVGKTILMKMDDLPEDVNLYDVEAIMDCEVADTKVGSLGHITEVMQGPANDIWVVEGPFGEVLLPVVDALLVCIDNPEDPHLITVDTPLGLNDKIDALKR